MLFSMGQEQMQEVTILYTYVHILKAYIRLFICFALGTWKYMKYLLGLHLRLFIEPQQGLLFVQMYDGLNTCSCFKFPVILWKMMLVGWRPNISPFMVVWSLQVSSNISLCNNGLLYLCAVFWREILKIAWELYHIAKLTSVQYFSLTSSSTLPYTNILA